MEPPETRRHSFIVRIWVEEFRGDGSTQWRGHITHVLSGRQSYFDCVDTMTEFICAYLKEMGSDCSDDG